MGVLGEGYIQSAEGSASTPLDGAGGATHRR